MVLSDISGGRANKHRAVLPDAAKGLAAASVVLVHCLQELNGYKWRTDELYWGSRLNMLQHSFNLPLFMLITGFFSCRQISRARTLREGVRVLLGRSFACLFPVFAWTGLEYLLALFSYPASRSPGEILLGYLISCSEHYWFLWAVFYCYLVIWVGHFFLKDSLLLHGLLFLSLFVLPDEYGMNTYKFMYPFFLAGYYAALKKESIPENPVVKKARSAFEDYPLKTLFAAGALYFGLFLLYNDKVFIFVSGYRITNAAAWKMIAVDLYRMTVGFAGAGFFLMLLSALIRRYGEERFRVLPFLGRNSLGIYLLQGYVIILFLRQYTDPLSPSLLRTCMLVAAVLGITSAATECLGRIPGIRLLVGK